jgi:hypothetical protein
VNEKEVTISTRSNDQSRLRISRPFSLWVGYTGKRKQIAGELIRIERKLDFDIEMNDHYDIRYALVDLETRIRPRVARLSRDIDSTINNPDQRAGEEKFQRGLLEDITRILFKAGYVKYLGSRKTENNT